MGIYEEVRGGQIKYPQAADLRQGRSWVLDLGYAEDSQTLRPTLNQSVSLHRESKRAWLRK
jgi:hypothetical protein